MISFSSSQNPSYNVFHDCYDCKVGTVVKFITVLKLLRRYDVCYVCYGNSGGVAIELDENTFLV